VNAVRKIKIFKEIFTQTLNLISLYKKFRLPDKKFRLTVPFTLKGNLGEFIVIIELLKRFPTHPIEYRGGAFPGIDIVIDSVKIQVKTQIKNQPKKFKNGIFDFENSPTIKKSTLDKGKCDILILVILYPNKNFSKILKQNIYIFDKNDFKMFSRKFCWSGKSKGDYTIVNVLKVEGTPPKKLKEVIKHYNTSKYKRLFVKSKANWGKIEKLF